MGILVARNQNGYHKIKPLSLTRLQARYSDPDMPSTYFYAVRVEELPVGFQAEIARLNVAQKGVWETNAPNATKAEQQIIEFVQMMTRERIEPGTLQVKRTTALLNEIEAAAVLVAIEAAPEPIAQEMVPEPEPTPVVHIEAPAPQAAPKRSKRWIEWLLRRRGWWALETMRPQSQEA
jgi:hypothetical protein